MPWYLKKIVYLYILGVLSLALSIVVWILNQDASTDILAGVGVLGGAAIIVNNLPVNGTGRPQNGS